MSCVPMAPSASRGRSRAASCSRVAASLLEGIMDGFENQTPFVFAAVRVAVAARRCGGPAPGQYIVQGLSQQRLLTLNCGHQGVGLFQVLAHVRMAGVAGCRTATLFAYGIAFFFRTQHHVVIEREGPPHVGAGGALITKACVNGTVGKMLDGEPLCRPTFQGFFVC